MSCHGLAILGFENFGKEGKFVNEGPFGPESGRKAVEIAGDVLKQLLQGKHTVLTQSVCLFWWWWRVGEEDYGEGFVETLRQSNRWCFESIPGEPRHPGVKSQVDSRSEVSRSEV